MKHTKLQGADATTKPWLGISRSPRSPIFALAWLLLFPSACGDDEVSCTAERRGAVNIIVQDDSGAPLRADDVVVSKGSQVHHCSVGPGAPCSEHASPARAGKYSVLEMGGGEYTVTVRSGQAEQTQSTSVQADECHTTEVKTLTFVFERSTAM